MKELKTIICCIIIFIIILCCSHTNTNNYSYHEVQYFDTLVNFNIETIDGIIYNPQLNTYYVECRTKEFHYIDEIYVHDLIIDMNSIDFTYNHSYYIYYDDRGCSNIIYKD